MESSNHLEHEILTIELTFEGFGVVELEPRSLQPDRRVTDIELQDLIPLPSLN